NQNNNASQFSSNGKNVVSRKDTEIYQQLQQQQGNKLNGVDNRDVSLLNNTNTNTTTTSNSTYTDISSSSTSSTTTATTNDNRYNKSNTGYLSTEPLSLKKVLKERNGEQAEVFEKFIQYSEKWEYKNLVQFWLMMEMY